MHQLKASLLISASILLGSWIVGSQVKQLFNQVYTGTHALSSEIALVRHSIDELSKTQEKDHFTYSEAAKYLGITENEMQLLIKETNIPYTNINNKYIFHKAPLDVWLLQNSNKFQVKNK